MSKELTEKWQKGTLPCGSYYLKLISGAIRADFFEGLKFCYFNSKDIEEILAPVPTYDEYNELEKENGHLKSLLRKTKSSVRNTISVFKGKCIVLDGQWHEKHVKKYQDLLKKITEATKKKDILE